MKSLNELNDAGHRVVIITHEEEVACFAKQVVRLRDGSIKSDQVQPNRAEVNA